MAVYWNVTSYKKDSSYITGEVKSRGLYEFKMAAAKPFRLDNTISFRHGIQFFYELIKSRDLFECGINDLVELFFYFDADDLIGGSNLREFEGDIDEHCGMLREPHKILDTLQRLSSATSNFENIEFDEVEQVQNKYQVEQLRQLIELLIEAQKNDYLLHFYFD